MSNSFIYGKDNTQRVVAVEASDRTMELFIEEADGTVRTETRQQAIWALASKPLGPQWSRLEGDNHFRFKRVYRRWQERQDDWQRAKPHMWVSWDAREAAMLDTGVTYFKGMRPTDVSVLSFDIESTGIEHCESSRVLLISNTFRRNGFVERKLFACDDYATDAEMFEAWSQWVRDRNPSLVIGHNIFMYDLPYMAFCAAKAGVQLLLGRDGSALRFDKRESRYRRDGSQDYMYRNALVYGREVVDTFFLAFKYDYSRKYESYGLKQIVKQEGLERQDRQHYDAARIAPDWADATKRPAIKAYAEHDADDALALFDRMVTAFFYLSNSVPKPFQTIINSASGAWLNSFLIRSYLERNHSVPAASEAAAYEGAISLGNPGIYRNVFKVDVASLYPSIMLQYEVSDPAKDPLGSFHRMVSFFTAERLENKRRAKESGDRHYSDLEQAQKIFINSAYGMLGAPGLHFNSPTNAAFITRQGRELLQGAIDWASVQGLQLVNADTDSISVASAASWTDESKRTVLAALNGMSPEKIRWEDDGVYDAVLVLKAKNYVLRAGTKTKLKGSAIKATLKEPALREFIQRATDALLDGEPVRVESIYREYVMEICNLADIKRWSFKKTVTESVLNPERTNEQKVLDALDSTDIQMGDKVYLFFTQDGSLKRVEDWAGDHDVAKLLKKLHNTVEIFDAVLDVSKFPNLSLKGRGKKKPTPLQLFLQSA